MSRPLVDVQTLVIGAGAAGIAAARALLQAGLSVLVLEARSRIGGRAWTRVVAGYKLDLGCGWLHSADDNVLAGLARDHRVTVDASLPPWMRRQRHNFPAAELEDLRAAQSALEARIEIAGEAPGDCSADTLLESGCRWNPLLHAMSTHANGTGLDTLSVKDVSAYHDSGINHRVIEGMGTLVAALGDALPIKTDCPVSMVDHSAAKIVVSTPKGSVRCDSVIVTVPTNVIAKGTLRFSPELPDKQHAAAKLPLGIANKIFLHVRNPNALPKGGFMFGRRDRAATGSYHFRPFGWPLIEGYFGGACAKELETAGEAAFAAHAIDELAAGLGNDWRKRITVLASSAWVGDPFAQGSYSAALPHHAEQRAVLAAPIESRIFFAGEATSPHYFSTAHGAYETGLRAAYEAKLEMDL